MLLPDSISVAYSPGSATVEDAWKVSYTSYVRMQKFFWLSSGWLQADAQAVAHALWIPGHQRTPGRRQKRPALIH